MDPCPVLVGREQEMAALRALLDAGGGVAIVSGEAGIGKSRLVREFAAVAAEAGRVVLWGRPEEVAQPGPYALIVDLLESIAERGSAELKKEARALESELVRPIGTDDQRPAPTARAVAAEIRGLVAQLGLPPLLVLEDLHWADEASHSVVLNLARAARDDGHVLVATIRNEAADSEPSLVRLSDALLRGRVAESLLINPLTDDETATMLELLWKRPPREDELEKLRRLGEGVPFLIEELAASSASNQMSLVPPTVEQSVAARLHALGEEVETVVRTASLLAGPLDPPVLAEACNLSEESVAGHLAEATRAGLLIDRHNLMMFRHALVRDAVASGLTSVETAQTHARLAYAIEKVHSDELDPFAAALAGHYWGSGDSDSAARHAERAGERALAFAATSEARAAFSLALQVTKGSSLAALRGLAETEFREGNEREAAKLFRAAADEMKRSGDNVHAAQTLGRLAWTLQGLVAAGDVIKVLDEGVALVAGDINRVEYARLMVQKGSLLCFVFNQASDSEPILREALGIAINAEEHSIAAEALDGLAQAASLEGFSDEALRLGGEAVIAARRSEWPEAIGRTHNNHAVKLAAYGQPIEALEVLAEGRQQMLRTFGRAAVGAIDVTQAWVMWLMGAPSEVAHLTARGRSAWQRWRGYRWLLEIWAAIELGEMAVARARTREAWAETIGDISVRDYASNAKPLDFELTQVVLAQALLQSAERNFTQAAELTGQLVLSDDPQMESLDKAQILSVRAVTLMECNQLDDAIEMSERLAELSERHPYPYIRALSCEIRGVLAARRDNSEDAEAFLEQAIREFGSCSNSSDRARCMRLLAETRMRLVPSASDPNQNLIEHLRAAREIAKGCGAFAEANRIEAALRTMGVRPRAGRPRRDPTGSSNLRLSPRESEIAALVAAGETNADIATRLFLSERTVQDHITHALRKLAIPGRAALASWAVKQGMI